MGLTGYCLYKESANDNGKIDFFNKNYKIKDTGNSTITLSSKECKLSNIGQKGFEELCKLKLKNIEILYLDHNEISSIECLVNFKSPNLKQLGLECNDIVRIDIFEKVIFPLESLDLRCNYINDVSIFKKDSTLPKLKKLLLNNNKFDINNEEVKYILNNLKIRMKKKDKDSELDYNDDDNIKKILSRIKTINDKLIKEPKDKYKISRKNTINEINNLKIGDEVKKKLISYTNKLSKSIITFKHNPNSGLSEISDDEE
jgi:hypothetical protein